MRFIELIEGPDRIQKLIDLHADGVGMALKGDALHIPATPEELHDYAANAIKEMANFDPTPGLKYLNWMVLRYKKGLFKWEDLEKLKPQLEMFDKLVKTKRIEKRDIMQYQTPTELYGVLKPFLDGEEAVSADDERRRLYSNSPHGRIVYQSPECTVVVPETWESARFWGSNTNWCTVASESAYEQYMGAGKLYNIWLNSGDGVAKYQFHFEEQQLFNADDGPLSDEEFRSIPQAAWAAMLKEVDMEDRADLTMSQYIHSLPMRRFLFSVVEWDKIPLWKEREFCLRKFFREPHFLNELDQDLYVPILKQLEPLDMLQKIKYSWKETSIVKACNEELKTRELTASDFDYQGPESFFTEKLLDHDIMKKLLTIRPLAQIYDQRQYEILTNIDTPHWVRDEIAKVATPAALIATAIKLGQPQPVTGIVDKLPLGNPKRSFYIPQTDKQSVMRYWEFRPSIYEPEKDDEGLYHFYAEVVRQRAPLLSRGKDMLEYASSGTNPFDALRGHIAMKAFVVKFDDTTILVATTPEDTDICVNGKLMNSSVLSLYNVDARDDLEPKLKRVLKWLGNRVEKVQGDLYQDFVEPWQ